LYSSGRNLLADALSVGCNRAVLCFIQKNLEDVTFKYKISVLMCYFKVLCGVILCLLLLQPVNHMESV
jgi:hypothetical protein